jgi:hypothetical protein
MASSGVGERQFADRADTSCDAIFPAISWSIDR